MIFSAQILLKFRAENGICSAVKFAPECLAELQPASELLEVNICKQADMVDETFAEFLNSERCTSA